MSLVIEIFRTDDYVPDGEIPLLPVLKTFFREVIGDDPSGIVFELFFYDLPDRQASRDLPTLVNLRGSHGYVRVRIRRDSELIYQHPHPVREIIGVSLRAELLARDPGMGHWGYGVRGPGLESIPLVRPAPQPTHELRANSTPRGARLFDLEEVTEPDPPARSLVALGVTEPDGAGSRIQVTLAESLATAMTETMSFSSEVEEGGFLIGEVFRDENREDAYIVNVSGVVRAERTGASMLNFTFTGESFLRISEQLTGRTETLLGWYHTHLFRATKGLGLSSVDVNLHRSTFRRPWQVAALLNITAESRVLRFYYSDGDAMVRAAHWAVPS